MSIGVSWGAKGRRTGGRKSRFPRTTRTWGAKKSRTIVSKVKTLSRAISKLNKVALNRINYQQNGSFSMSNATGLADYASVPLLKFSTWSRIFGTDADDESNKQALVRSTKANWQMWTSEPDGRSYSFFVVSLKDQANELLNTDGTLGTLTSGTHYAGTGGQVLLNLKFFNLHYYRRRIAGVNPQEKSAGTAAPAVQNIGATTNDSIQQGTFLVKYGKNGMKVLNPSGDWKAGVYPKDPSKNYYIIVFWDGDSTADLQVPTMYYNMVHSVDVTA